MQYSKPMIDLVYEIRRRVDAKMKPGIKLANPDMLQELAEFHHDCKDTITRTLIKELLSLAGEPWVDQLDEPKPKSETPKPDTPKQITKVYRGQVSLVDAPTTRESHRPVRIYRGQVVEY
jgi:hypothetical protein